MKRIYLFWAALFSLTCTTAFAQTDDEEWGIDEDAPLILDATQLSSPWTDPSEGSLPELIDGTNSFWHSSWHSNPPHNVMGSHYLQVEMPDGYYELGMKIAIRFMRRNTDNNQITVWSVRGTNDEFDATDQDALDALYADPLADKEQCVELVHIETPIGSDQAETSKYVITLPFDPQGYKYLRFYADATESYSGGEHNATFWHLGEIQLFPWVQKTEEDIVFAILNEAYDKYSAELANYEMLTGEGPGLYSDDAYNDFYEAVEALLDEDVQTRDAAHALIDDVVAKLEALKESRNMEYSIESGYYFIKTAMSYSDGLDKYLMGDISADNVLQACWHDFERYEDAGKFEEGKARMLWKIENKGDGTYGFVNSFKNGRFTSVERSANVVMCREDTTFMAIEPVFTDMDGATWVNIRPSKQAADDYHYIHQNNHGNGSGTGSNIVGWTNSLNRQDATAGGSEWIFEPVDDAEAEQIIEAWSELNDMDSKIRDIRKMIREGKDSLVVAKDIQSLVEEDKPIVSEENQVTSPCSDSAEGQHIEYLWDNDISTWWHTDWHNAFTTEEHHYVQVEIPDDLASAVMRINRRNTTSGNQINKWSVWGTNEDDFELTRDDEGFEKLADLETPYHSGNYTETLTSLPFETKGYKYLRFYCEGTCNNDGSQGGNTKFFHISEFQVFPGELYQSETCQYNVMGATATKLEELIEQLDPMEDEEFTIEDYNALKAAYDAFMAKFVDPNPLREAIASHANSTSEVVVGTDPGFWPANSSATQLDATIESAKAYDEAGAYTDAQTQKFIADMASLEGNIPGEANKVQEGKWYRIRYGKEEEYDQYKWSKEGNGIDNRVVDEEVIGMYNEEIYGKYVTVAHDEDEVIDTDENGADVMGHRVLPMSREDVTLETYVYGDALEDIEDKDMALWRFINVGDSAYIIQNKATGLFMRQDGNMRVSVQPTLFNQLIAGYGQNAFIAKQFESGATWSPLHFARNYNILTLWGSLGSDGVWSGMGSKDGRRACFFVEEVEDVASDFAFGDFKISFTPGDIYGRCYPVPVTVKDANQGTVWTVNSMERTAGDEETPELVKLDLAKITVPTIPAGRPFLYIVDGDMPEDGEEYEPAICDFSFTLDLVNVPKTDSFLKGAFDSKTINQKWIGVGSGHDEEALQFNSSGSSTGVNRTYILDTDPAAEPFATNAELEFNFDESLEDGIKEAIKTVSRIGNIYTLDGRLVGRGNINSITQKGVYIVNGIKVTIK